MRAGESLRASERFAREILDALSEHIPILDEEGRIPTVNEAWRDLARKNGLSLDGRMEGASCLEVCDNARGADGELATAFVEGIHSLTRGEREEFMYNFTIYPG